VDEKTVRAMMRDGLAVREPIWFGRWSGRDEGLSFQDVVVAEPHNSQSVAAS